MRGRCFPRVVAGVLLVGAVDFAEASSLERFQAFIQTTQSASAEFRQEVYDRNRKLLQAAHGRFSFVRPGRFRWVYASPTRQVIVGDGARVWVYDEELAQVTVRGMARAIGSTPAALLAGSTEVDRAFAFAEGGTQEGLDWLEARPRNADAGFEIIRLGFDLAGIAAMELVDHFGQRTVLKFSALARNPELDAKEFRFDPPPGVDVLGDAPRR